MNPAPRHPDAFDLLGLPPSFAVDLQAVRAAHLQRSAALHPDHAAPGGGSPEQELAAARLNDARSTLEDPERRANELLRRLGGPDKEADRSLPDGFLPAMLALREEAEPALASGDEAALDPWLERAELIRREHVCRVGELFAAFTTPPDPASLKLIRRELNAWRYAERLIEQLRAGASL